MLPLRKPQRKRAATAMKNETLAKDMYERETERQREADRGREREREREREMNEISSAQLQSNFFFLISLFLLLFFTPT